MRIKVLIPTYNRSDCCKTHLHFTNSSIWDFKYVVHNDEQKEQYIKNGINEQNLIVSNVEIGKGGLVRQRIFIEENLIEIGEWYISGDDDIENITRMKDPLYNTQEIDIVTKEDFEYKVNEEDFKNIFDEMVQLSDSIGCKLFGFSFIDNFFFRKKKIRENCMIIGTLWCAKKDKENLLNTSVKLKEDHFRFANSLLRNGIVLRNDYVGYKTKMYSSGGIGSKKDRRNDYVEASEKLFGDFPHLFEKSNNRKDPDAEVRVRLRDRKLVNKWRLYMITQGKLDKQYAIDILGEKKGKEFIDKYCKQPLK